MARAEKWRPLLAIFIFDITYAFRNEPARKAMNEAKATRGASPKIAWKPSSSVQYEAPGIQSARAPKATNMKFMTKPVQIISLALRNPQTSAMQSLMMYEIGKTRIPPVMFTGPNSICLIAKRFAQIRQTQNSIPISMKDTETVFCFIKSCFLRGLSSTRVIKSPQR